MISGSPRQVSEPFGSMVTRCPGSFGRREGRELGEYPRGLRRPELLELAHGFAAEGTEEVTDQSGRDRFR